MPSNFDEKMPLYYEGNTLGILRRSFFPQDLRAFYTTVYAMHGLSFAQTFNKKLWNLRFIGCKRLDKEFGKDLQQV